MKAILCAGILLLLLVLSAGCTTTAPPGVAQAPAPPVPNLVGNWSGTSTGYIGGTGYTDYSGDTITMKVNEQKDRIFNGEFIISNRSSIIMTMEFCGVIGRDGRTLTIAERNEGYSLGTIVAPDEIELIHIDDNEPSDVAIDTLKKR